MQRIGLLTIHNTINFGSQLQMLSLYKAIEKIGGKVSLVDYKCEAIAARESTLPLKDAKSPKDVLKSLLLHGNLEKRKKSFCDYINNNINITKEFDRSTIHEANNLFDSFIVGSDIVWGLNITGNDFTYMLDFAEEGKKKLSFSSSVGTKWDEVYQDKIYKCLSRFDSIAVREYNASEWIGHLLGREIPVTCDPTMLWDKKFWTEFCAEQNTPQQKYILVYMSDPENECVKRAIQFGKEKKMSVYYINYRAPVWGTIDKRPTSLQEWIGLFKNAETVFSASYHGLLYSLYFHRNVFYFNWTNKSRMESIAKEFGIEHREGTLANIRADRPMEYDKIDMVLQRKRNDSWEKLRNMMI